jgi:hypothetical protein
VAIGGLVGAAVDVGGMGAGVSVRVAGGASVIVGKAMRVAVKVGVTDGASAVCIKPGAIIAPIAIDPQIQPIKMPVKMASNICCEERLVNTVRDYSTGTAMSQLFNEPMSQENEPIE